MDTTSCPNINPLAIPNTKWNTISINFIVELQKLLQFDVVMTMINSVSKRVYFIPIHTIVTTEKTAKLFLDHIQKLHSPSTCTVSNRGLCKGICFNITTKAYGVQNLKPNITDKVCGTPFLDLRLNTTIKAYSAECLFPQYYCFLLLSSKSDLISFINSNFLSFPG